MVKYLEHFFCFYTKELTWAKGNSLCWNQRKGGFIFNSDEHRKNWHTSDIQFKSWNVMHMQLDPRDQRLHAATSHFVYGPTTHYSDDLGKTWTQAKQVPILTTPVKIRPSLWYCG